MSKATYLVRRGNIFYARIPLSINDQLVFNRREIWRSLQTSDYNDALEKLSSALALYNANKMSFMQNDDPELSDTLTEKFYVLRFNQLHDEAREIIDRKAEFNYDSNFEPLDIDPETNTMVYPKVDINNLQLEPIQIKALLKEYADSLYQAKESAEQGIAYREYKTVPTLTKGMFTAASGKAEKLYKSSTFCEGILKAEIKALKAHIKAYEKGDTLLLGRIESAPSVSLPQQNASVPSKGNPTLGELQETYYTSEYYKNKTKRTREKELGYRKFTAAALGAETRLSELKIRYVEQKFIPALRHAPKNWSAVYRGKTMDEIIEAEEKKPSKNKKFTPTTANAYLKHLNNLMNFAERYEYTVPPHNYRHLSLKQELQARYRRKPLQIEALNTLLSHEKFLENKDAYSEAHKYWVPIICILTGMRMSEPLMMTLDAIKNEKGIAFFDVSPNEMRSVKTEQSIRRIPINETLVKLGFLEYVASVRRRKGNRIFPHYAVTYTTSAGNKFSKWFNHLLKRIGLKEERVSFHSTRHSYNDFTKNSKLSESDYRLAGTLAGWAQGKSVRDNYGWDASIQELARVANLIDFSALNLSHLYPKRVRK